MSFFDKIASYIPQIDSSWQESLMSSDSRLDSLYEPTRYLMSLGGKRLRPALSMLVCDICLSDPNQALPSALAVEIFHNFSLMHDDIMDEAPLRRGKPTVHIRNGVNTAILSGDAMLIKSLQQLNHYPSELSALMMKSFLQTALEVCEGQQLDMDLALRKDVSADEYLQMIRLKTSVLLGESARLGALAAGVDSVMAQNFYDFAVDAGIAFQIQDDYLDAFGNPDQTGKQAGGDILANKNTLIRILALQSADDIQKLKLTELFNAPPSQEKVDQTTQLYIQLQADRQVKEVSNLFLSKSIQSLAGIPYNTDFLVEMANYFVSRSH
jgi:geranylgeranyl diphosphate synthase type II